MKHTPIFLLMFSIAPFGAGAQVVDTAAVAREVDSLILVSRSLAGQGDFDRALEVNAIAEKLTLEKLGRETKAYGSICFNQGRVSYLKSDFTEAEKWCFESKNIREKVLGRENPDYAYSVHLLGNVYFGFGDFEKAEQFFLEAKDIRERVLGKKDTLYAWSLNNLANVNLELGNYEKCESLHLQAKAIREAVLGKEHPDYASSLHNLANLYWRIGSYRKSASYYLESIAIQEKTLSKGLLAGRAYHDYIWSLNNLGILYWRMGNYEKAEPLQLKVKAIRENVQGKERSDYAWSLNRLANLYFDMGHYEKAESFFLESKTIQEKTNGKEDASYACILDNLANLYKAMGHYEQAEPLFIESKAILEKVLGKEHPDYTVNLNNLANLYYEMGNYDQAEPLFEQLSNLNQSLLIRSLRYQSERELNNYLNTFSTSQNQILSFAQTSINEKKHFSQICYDYSLFYKGFLLYNVNQIKHLALFDSSATEKLKILKSYERRLAVEYAQPIVERDSAQVEMLESSANTLEKDLARTVTGYGEVMRQVRWQEVQAALKPGEVAVEFVHYHYFTPKATDSTMYAALVLRPLSAPARQGLAGGEDLSKEGGDSEPQFIPLFEEKELTPLMRGAAGGSNFLKINALYAQKTTGSKQKSLYELIWQPLETLLAGSKTVYCASSGLLHRINLSAISTDKGQVYGDSRQVVVLGSTRQIVMPNPFNQTSTNDAYLVGGIRYDADSTAIATANQGTSLRGLEQPNMIALQSDSLTRSGVLDYLPATATEVRDIGQALADAGIRAIVDTGFYATEEVFRRLGDKATSPRIIHLATHGYFFPDPVACGSRQSALGSVREPVFKMSEHPMIRSGLIMAGAKQAWLTGKHPEGLEDGILTAYEISQMNLSGTELVVLSACETGLGDIVGNEGVYGLQRAFKIAGAKYLIMSLWKVDDKSTRAFMSSFYRHWLMEKLTVPEAFRSTQQEMRAKYSGAYDWAGFVLIE